MFLRLAEHRPQVAPGASVARGAAPVEVLAGLEHDRDAGVRAARTSSIGTSADRAPDRRSGPALRVERSNTTKWLKLPVQDRAARQVPQVVDVRAARRARAARSRARASPMDSASTPSRPAPVTSRTSSEIDALAVVAEHHGQAGRAAVGDLHLPDARDPPPHGAAAWPSMARNWRARTSAIGSERSTTDAWARRCASSARRRRRTCPGTAGRSPGSRAAPAGRVRPS